MKEETKNSILKIIELNIEQYAEMECSMLGTKFQEEVIKKVIELENFKPKLGINFITDYTSFFQHMLEDENLATIKTYFLDPESIWFDFIPATDDMEQFYTDEELDEAREFIYHTMKELK